MGALVGHCVKTSHALQYYFCDYSLCRMGHAIGFVLSTEIFVVVKFHRFVKVVCQGPLTFYEILSD